jgi:hypothetical protein
VLIALFFFLGEGVSALHPIESIAPWLFFLVALFFFLAEGVMASHPLGSIAHWLSFEVISLLAPRSYSFFAMHDDVVMQ